VFRFVVGLALLAGAGLRSGAQSPARPIAHPLHLPTVPGLDEYVPAPADNPLTVERVALGRRLFFDSLLSSVDT
jgi:cytochrome c peroxidase